MSDLSHNGLTNSILFSSCFSFVRQIFCNNSSVMRKNVLKCLNSVKKVLDSTVIERQKSSQKYVIMKSIASRKLHS